jgi:hypothetical protein
MSAWTRCKEMAWTTLCVGLLTIGLAIVAGLLALGTAWDRLTRRGR